MDKIPACIIDIRPEEGYCIQIVDQELESYRMDNEDFIALSYKNGGYSYITKDFFSARQNGRPDAGILFIGKYSSIGYGSVGRYDHNHQIIRIGKYVTTGMRVKFICGGRHDMQALTTCPLNTYDTEFPMHPYLDTAPLVIKNDVWIGDEAMILGGSVIENGCVIGARSLVPYNFKTEPYGVYAGVPAKLIKYRFPEDIRAKLLTLAWWDKPFSWVKEHKEFFMKPVTHELLEELC